MAIATATTPTFAAGPEPDNVVLRFRRKRSWVSGLRYRGVSLVLCFFRGESNTHLGTLHASIVRYAKCRMRILLRESFRSRSPSVARGGIRQSYPMNGVASRALPIGSHTVGFPAVVGKGEAVPKLI